MMQSSSFFDRVKSQIPAIDSDASSSSDNEEEISLYQRPSVFRWPQGAEVGLDYLSLEEPGIEDLLKSATEPFTYETGDKFCEHKDDVTPLIPKEYNDHKVLVAAECDFEKLIFSSAETKSVFNQSVDLSKLIDKELLHEPKQSNSIVNAAEGESTSQMSINSESERLLQTTAGEICGKQSLEKMHTQSFPILSLKPLENWDLDQVLRSLKEGAGYRKNTSEQREPLSFQPLKYTDYDNESPEINIMDRLAAFCKKQASKKVDTTMINTSEKTRGLQRPYLSSPATIRQTEGCTDDCKDIAAKLHQKNIFSPTVYIDLRNTEHQTKPAVTCNTSSTPDVSKHSLSTVKVVNTQLEAATKNRVLTGKSLLLQQIRESNRTQNFVQRKTPDDSVKPQKEIILVITQDQHSCRNPPPIKHLDRTSFSPIACDESAASPDITLTSHRKKGSDHEQKEQQKNKAQQQLYLKHLLTLRPQQSTNAKQSAAEMTNVLYDTDGSYLPSVSTLPPHLQSSKCLLLTVTLSSPGVVAGRAQGKAQSVQSTTVKSYVYNSLIAWFMSLAEPNSYSMKDNIRNTGNTAPFWVAGLQQFWRDDGLVLYVCAVSHEESQSLYIKPRRMHVKKGWTLFHQQVSRFLSHTQLSTVVSWLPQLNLLLEQQAYPALISLPSLSLDCFISISPDKKAVEKAFGMSPGFYWQTLETREQICQRAEAMTSQQPHTEVVIALGYRPLFLNPLATHHTLQLLQSSGLDVCGLRLTYPSEEHLENTAVHVKGGHGLENSHQPVLALAIRGPYTSSVWQEITGPSDPQLAQRTDPVSVNALYCPSQDQPLFFSPRLASRVHLCLAVWFGGRVPKTCLIVSAHEKSFSDKEVRVLNNVTSSPATLCATVKGDVFLLVSPVVPPCCYSYVLSVCAKRGFHLMGLQRVQISSKHASSLGFTSEQMSAFCHAPTVFLDGKQYSHSLVLLLRRENALRHCASLSTGLMNELAVQGFVGLLQARLASGVRLGPDLCCRAVPYAENLFNFLGGLMWTLPDFSHVILSNPRYPSCSEMEQIVILTLTGHNIMEEGIRLLHKVTRGDVAGGAGEERFELLALKWLPTLSLRQAQELSPFEVGDRLWQSSLASLASSPALVCALRRLQAFGTLRRLLPQDYPGNLSVLMSPTPEMAFRQASLFFTEAELIPDHSSRTTLKFLPPLSIVSGFKSQSFYSCMAESAQPLFTLALFKPGVWRHCLGKILSKIQQNGFTLVGLRVLVLDSKMADVLMDALEQQDHSEKQSALMYLRSGPALALCLQRMNAVKRLLDLLGPEDPAEALAGDPHFWRASYGTDRVHNGIYGSLSYQKAVQDIKMIFSDGLCCTETSIMKHEQIPCLSSDPAASLERQQSHTITSIAKNKLSQCLIEESGLIRVGCSVRSALCQTTCLFMPSSLLQLSRPPLHLDLLEQLLRTGCHLVAGRLSTPDKAQRRHISELLKPPGGGAVDRTLLSEGPCLILALQKDNVVTCFDMILQSICRARPDFENVRKMLLYPSSENKAVKLLCFLFDGFSPDSHHIIVQR